MATETEVSPKQLLEAVQKLGEAVQELKANDQRADAEKKKNGGDAPETKEERERINDAIDQVEDLKERLRQIELKAAREAQLPPGDFGHGAPTVDLPEKEAKAYDEAFILYARRGEKALSPAQAEVLQKALSTDSNADGGFVVTRTVDTNVRLKLIQFSPVRELCNVETITGSEWEGPAEGDQDFSAGWVSERGTRGSTQTGQLRMDRIPAHEIYAEPPATQKMLDDMGSNLETWMTGRLVDRFRVIEGTGAVIGTANGQMEGFLTNSKVTAVKSNHATQVTADGMIALYYDLPEFYAKNATWLMKRDTVRQVRTLKDGQQQYLWQAGLAGAQPSTILSAPFREAVDMPVVGAGTFPVAIADWKSAYKMVDRKGMQTLRDPYTQKGFILFYTTYRVGGAVVMAEAIRKLQIGT